jgi:hypothetical protein
VVDKRENLAVGFASPDTADAERAAVKQKKAILRPPPRYGAQREQRKERWTWECGLRLSKTVNRRRVPWLTACANDLLQARMGMLSYEARAMIVRG